MPITSDQYLKDQLSKDRKLDTQEELIRQFENQAQQDVDLTLTEAIQDIYISHMKDNTNTTTDPKIDRATGNKIKGKLTDPPKKGRQQKQTKGR